MKWSPEQGRAIDAVRGWLKTPSKPTQIFRLFGHAGTGKTTLAKHLASLATGEVPFASFTGKAALVLRQKGCSNASTIHSLIYNYDRFASKGNEDPKFILNKDSMVKDADFVIIDECSMVGEELAKDLMSFGKPILVLGDPGQLPPVKDAGFFTNAKPDFMLEEVHRQARDNPIIRLSMDIRNGVDLEYGEYDGTKVIDFGSVDTNEVLIADQILVGRNVTRANYNRRVRQILRDRGDLKGDGFLPVKDDRLICLKNDSGKHLFNGSSWQVKNVGKIFKKKIALDVGSDDFGSYREITVKIREEFFIGGLEGLTGRTKYNSDQFDYGYAITCHKSQGSQWENVYIFDESGIFREDATKWLYTAITRASERATIVC